MKIYSYIITAILAIAMFASCEPSGNGSGSEVNLIPSSATINADGADSVYFTVLSGETDVTADAQVFTSSNQEVISKSFGTDIPGDYRFFAIYNGVRSKDTTITALSGLTLTADKETISANGIDVVTFSVIQNGKDITAECTFYLAGEQPTALEGNIFSTTEPGTYSFYATKDDATSNTVTVNAMVAENSAPAAWDFYGRSLAIEITGTWCGPCSMMKAGFKSLEQSGWDTGYAAECHAKDSMTNPQIYNLVASAISYTGYIPYICWNFDANYISEGAIGTVAGAASYISQMTDAANAAYPCTAGAAASFYEENGTLIVDANIAISEAGNYKVNCWLLEDNIEAYQNAYPEAQQWDINNHVNVIRAIGHTADIYGKTVSAGAQSTENFTWSFTSSSLVNKEPENAHVLIYITREEAGGYIVNNVIKCDFNSTANYPYMQ